MKLFSNPIAFTMSIFAFAPAAMAAAGDEVASGGIPLEWWIAPLASVIALVMAYYFYRKVMEAPEGNEKMVTIAGHVKEGAYAYLTSQQRASPPFDELFGTAEAPGGSCGEYQCCGRCHAPQPYRPDQPSLTRATKYGASPS